MSAWNVTQIRSILKINILSAFCRPVLASCCQICYSKDTKKGTTAHKGLTLKVNWKFIESPPCLGQSSGWFFYALKHYLINVNTNVSNARMNIPKAIKSLKSKGFLSISTTPILCRIEVSHPATRLFLVEVYHIPIRISTDCCHLVNLCILLHKCTFFPIR